MADWGPKKHPRYPAGRRGGQSATNPARWVDKPTTSGCVDFVDPTKLDDTLGWEGQMLNDLENQPGMVRAAVPPNTRTIDYPALVGMWRTEVKNSPGLPGEQEANPR